MIGNMLTGEKLISGLEYYPHYEPSMRNAPVEERLILLNDIYDIYYPLPMSVEIYSKLYMSLSRSLRKKNTQLAVRQINENRKRISSGVGRNGIIGGADSFTIFGRSGIGKSFSISRAVALMHGEEVVEYDTPFQKIVPVLVVQCPFDSSVKGLILEILRKVDEVIDSKYFSNAVRAKATTDMLIGSVSTVCLNHIGLLIIDEVQNVANSKNGRALIGSLTQLINNSGISIAMVGTPDSVQFFEQDYKLARRSLGLEYSGMPLDDTFVSFCRAVWRYQYTRDSVPLSDGVVRWLYDHSNGITSNVITMIHDAEEIAILDGTDTLSQESLKKAYTQRMSLLHGYLENRVPTYYTGKCDTGKSDTATDELTFDTGLFAKAASRAKKEGCTVLSLIAGQVTVEEVSLE